MMFQTESKGKRDPAGFAGAARSDEEEEETVLENVKEFFTEELKKITEGEITENDKRHLNNCIRMFKNSGKTLDEMLALATTDKVREYVLSRWDMINPF